MDTQQDAASSSTILVHYIAPLDQYHAQEHIDTIRLHDSPNAPLSASDSSWRIENKYYTKSVSFKSIDTPLPSHEFPAVIVLVSRSQTPPSTLSALLAEHSSRESEFEISLLVSYPTSHAAASATLDEGAWDDLALSHGFEWVDLAVGNGGARIEDEGEDRIGEQNGVARIVEALHSHMWEGMTPAPKPQKIEKKATSDEETEVVEKSDEDDFSALGAPPLPEPRPFVPTPMSFPSTYLPSISKKSDASLPQINFMAAPTSFAIKAPTSTETGGHDTATFDDDFAAFVPALPKSITSFPPLSTPSSSEYVSIPSPTSPTMTEASEDVERALYRHPALSFPDNVPSEEAGDGGKEDEAIGDEDLDGLVEKLQAFRAEAEGMRSMEERRAFAERVVGGLGLLGA
ncbi:alpha- and gamma-adaptin-binding protein p34, partial [Phenoliferia sp. Uapishka_3]